MDRRALANTRSVAINRASIGAISFSGETGAQPNEVVELAPETVVVLRIAADLYTASGGLFNIAVGRQLIRTRFLPRMNTIHLNRFNGSMNDIEIIDERHVRFARRTLIDLGGIAKGYAVDHAVKALQNAGVSHGIVNAGGDLRVFGNTPMMVEVRMADRARSEPFMLQNTAMASSENAGTRHLFKGQTTTPHIGPAGLPIITDQTVTVTASTCVIADAMTKVAMIDADLAGGLLAEYDGQVVRFALSEAA
jgi:FAD:protein FMN transferase